MTDDPHLRHQLQCDACGLARARALVLTVNGGQLQLCGHHTEQHRGELERQDAALTYRELQAAQTDGGGQRRVLTGSRYRDDFRLRRVDPEADSDD